MEREEKRLEQFRRLRKEIRGAQDHVVVGLERDQDQEASEAGGQDVDDGLDVDEKTGALRSQASLRADRADPSS